ncbi:MAG: chloride channel protein, partial [Ruminococcus sp.]|nr:chloride channel protein [Ruminococcus sp.]
MKKLKNNLLFLLYTAVLGAIVGVIIWTFLRLMNLGIELFWDFLPSQISLPVYPLLICTLGGLLTGIWKRKFGDYPEELSVVLGSVKKTGRYKYSNVFSTIVSALLPLIIGASVGPEAGLTGIIAGLCTWVGDKLKRFRREVEELTEIGLSATLGTIFRSPMFGFMEPIESEEDAVLPKASKIVLYFAAILSSFGVFILLNRIFGIEVGFEGLEAEGFSPLTYLWAVPLTLAGIAGGWLFFAFKKLASTAKSRLEKYTVLRAVAGGMLLGISGTLLPLTMFSGESQITQVTENMKAIGAGML